MIRLTIDGKPVEVPEGTTVLAAAERLGISIPTLCYLEKVGPQTACMLCMVKVEGKGGLVPACSAPAEEGMRIATEDADVRRSRKFTLELLFSDHVGDCEAMCHLVCKARIDIPRLMRSVAEGDLRGAVEILRRSSGSPADPCHGCEPQCERACRRSHHDNAVSIRQVVRFVHEYGARLDGGWNGTPAPDDSDRFNCAMGRLKDGEMAEFLKDASAAPPAKPGGDLSGPEAAEEARRCLHCDCRKADTCALRMYADRYGVRQREYQPDERASFRRIRRPGAVLYEPEKCIKCGLCVRITEARREALGLAFVGRGFDVEVAVPFDEPLSAALTTTAEECVRACPTAALAFTDHREDRPPSCAGCAGCPPGA